MTDEAACIARIQHGKTDEYRKLVDRYQAGLIIHCENILKDRQDGEDIAQEAFIKAYQNLAHFSLEKAQFSTWLYKIATNLCIDQLRRHKRRVRVADIERYAEEADPESLRYDEILAIRQAVEMLEPPTYAEIIKAYFWEGKTYQEIAAQHETSVNTIGTWIHRAKRQLRGKLA